VAAGGCGAPLVSRKNAAAEEATAVAAAEMAEAGAAPAAAEEGAAGVALRFFAAGCSASLSLSLALPLSLPDDSPSLLSLSLPLLAGSCFTAVAGAAGAGGVHWLTPAVLS